MDPKIAARVAQIRADSLKGYQPAPAVAAIPEAAPAVAAKPAPKAAAVKVAKRKPAAKPSKKK